VEQLSASQNICIENRLVNRRQKELHKGHRGGVVWFTGLSGSGKSTLAKHTELMLYRTGLHTCYLDGDNIRHGLCKDLGFDAAGRTENMRRIGEVAGLLVDAGIVVLAAFISPYKEERGKLRKLIGEDSFFEVFCSCPLAVCEQRDVKGHYIKARQGLIQSFTGISSPYERPNRDSVIHIDTAVLSIEQSVDAVVSAVLEKLLFKCATGENRNYSIGNRS